MYSKRAHREKKKCVVMSVEKLGIDTRTGEASEKSLFTLSNCLQIKASKLGGMHRQKRVTQGSLL